MGNTILTLQLSVKSTESVFDSLSIQDVEDTKVSRAIARLQNHKEIKTLFKNTGIANPLKSRGNAVSLVNCPCNLATKPATQNQSVWPVLKKSALYAEEINHHSNYWNIHIFKAYEKDYSPLWSSRLWQDPYHKLSARVDTPKWRCQSLVPSSLFRRQT